MKKHYLVIEKDNSITIHDLEVEITFRPPHAYLTPDEHMYKVISPGQFQGEVFCWWALRDTQEEVHTQLGKIMMERLTAKFITFLKFLDVIINDKLGEKNKWRV